MRILKYKLCSKRGAVIGFGTLGSACKMKEGIGFAFLFAFFQTHVCGYEFWSTSFFLLMDYN